MNKTAYILLLIFLQAGILSAESKFSGSRLEEAVINYIYDKAGKDAAAQIVKSIQDIQFQEENVTAELSGSAKTFQNRSNIYINFMSGGKLLRRMTVPVQIQIYKEIPVANRNIRTGDIISKEDISSEKREITNRSLEDFPALQDIDGMEASRNIRKGDAILSNMLKYKKVVNRGENVEIIVLSGAVMIRAAGTAMEDGTPGESIKIKRNGMDSNVLYGRVAKDGRIYIASRKYFVEQKLTGK